MAKNTLDIIAMILVIIGGINWGLFGLAKIDLVNLLLGNIEWLANAVYILIGLSAIYLIYYAIKK